MGKKTALEKQVESLEQKLRIAENQKFYLKQRVSKLTQQVGGYQETLRANEYLMAAMVKCAGGEIVVSQEEIKAATEQGTKVMYQYDAEKRTFTMKTAE